MYQQVLVESASEAVLKATNFFCLLTYWFEGNLFVFVFHFVSFKAHKCNFDKNISVKETPRFRDRNSSATPGILGTRAYFPTLSYPRINYTATVSQPTRVMKCGVRRQRTAHMWAGIMYRKSTRSSCTTHTKTHNSLHSHTLACAHTGELINFHIAPTCSVTF